MGLRIQERGEVVKGTPVVQPGDDLFWFNHPHVLLYLIHFVLFQNAFQLAFFVWSWYEFGFRSCFHEKKEDVIIRITMGVLVQILCSYVILPLYALVTQMGSTMKPTIFNETVAKALRTWHHTARKHIKQKRHLGSMTPLQSQPSTPLNGTSPVHLLRYHKSEVDHVNISPGISNYTTEEQEAEGSVEHTQYHEASSWSHHGRNDDIMQEERVVNEQIRSQPGPVPQTHLLQHEVDIESSADFSFNKNTRM